MSAKMINVSKERMEDVRELASLKECTHEEAVEVLLRVGASRMRALGKYAKAKAKEERAAAPKKTKKKAKAKKASSAEGTPKKKAKAKKPKVVNGMDHGTDSDDVVTI